MPIISGITFGGRVVPYTGTRSNRRYSQNVYSSYQRNSARSNRAPSMADFVSVGAYKYNRTTRVMNAYSFYNKTADAPTTGTIINLEF